MASRRKKRKTVNNRRRIILATKNNKKNNTNNKKKPKPSKPSKTTKKPASTGNKGSSRRGGGRGGLVLAGGRDRQTAAERARGVTVDGIKKIADRINKWATKDKKWNEREKDKDALGLKRETKTGTYKPDYGASSVIAQTAMSIAANQESSKYIDGEVKELRDQGYVVPEEAIRAAKREAAKEAQKNVNAYFDKYMPHKIKYEYQNLTTGEYDRMNHAIRAGLASNNSKIANAMMGKDLAKKVRALNVKDYVKSGRLMGVLNQMSYAPAEADRLSGKYSKRQKAIIQDVKNSKEYSQGQWIGAALDFGLSGAGSMGSSLAKGMLKQGAKGFAKGAIRTGAKGGLKGIKGPALTQTVIRNGLKLSGKNLTNGTRGVIAAAAKSGDKMFRVGAGKKIAADVVSDAIVSTPFNAREALKFGQDENGKLNPAEAVKIFGINTAADMLFGGVLSGGGQVVKKFTKTDITKALRIKAKIEEGIPVTKAENKFYRNLMNEAKKAYVDKAGKQAVTEARAQYAVKATDNATVKAAKNFSVSKEALEAYRKADPEAIGADGVASSYVKAQDVPISLKQTYADFIASVDIKIKTAVQNLRNGKPAGAKSFDVAGVTVKEADVIKKELGLDVSEYRHTVEADVLLHIDKRHGIAGEANRNMTNANDIARMGYVIKNADSIEVIKDPSEIAKRGGHYLDSNGNIAPIAVYRKRINGDVVVVEAVPDAAAKELRAVSTYFDTNKKGNSERSDVKTPDNTSETNPPLMPFSKDSIPDPAGKINTDWEKGSKEAFENPGTQYKNRAEAIKARSKTAKEAYEEAMKGVSEAEVSQHAPKLAKAGYLTTEELIEGFNRAAKEGHFKSEKGITQKEALEDAYKQAKEDLDSLYKIVMDRNDFEVDTHMSAAQRTALLDTLSKKAAAGEDVTEKLLNVMEKDVIAAHNSGVALNAQKIILRTTPQGRLRVVAREAEKLSQQYADRLKGKKLELTEDQITGVLKAETEEEISKSIKAVNLELWDNIPATLFEKLNEIRHFNMLFNPKTHLRNLGGNFVFQQARNVSDAIEIGLSKAFKGKIEKMGGTVDMVKLSADKLKKYDAILEETFNINYPKSGSKNRYIETTRPDGSPIVRNKAMNALIQKNYAALEWGDVQFFLKKEYKKSYLRWCEARKIDIENMTDVQKMAADKYALDRAEIATFRDTSKFANWLSRMKNTTAGKKGKTGFGTAGYRTANVLLESQVPFVKTPVNIFRRSIDYSPISLIRAGAELARQTNPEMFKQGLHHLSTGLTGTGVFGLGMWLASKDIITLEAGDVSGDEYYDRDMGYQDYSIKINIGGKQYSITMDWVAPMQSSFFMGASAFGMMTKDGLSATDIFEGLFSITGPMLDMSFMSSTKDTAEMFIEQAFRNDDNSPDWSGAIMQSLFGSVPQGYLNAFTPQLSSQLAQALDSKQRDTRSTKEDPIEKSWESWGRKMINKIPVLRNYALNPKLDRFGEDKVTSNNIITRFINAFVNPSNVREIKYTDLDRKIIDIYNHMPDATEDEKKEKKYFFYNFTGNPSYDLINGKRMTYDEAYKYGKKNRQEQTKLIENMVNSKSYKNMTWDMKAKEVANAHFIGETYADRKVYGSKYAADKIVKYGGDSEKEARQLNKTAGGTDAEFVDFYITKEKLISRSHDSSYYTKALAVAMSGNDTMAKAYDIDIDKVKAAKEYLKNGGSFKEYTNAYCNIVSGITKSSVTGSMANKAVAAANHSINERTYRVMGFTEQQANMGVGIKKFGYTYDALAQMRMEAKYGFDEDQSGKLGKYELQAYIDSLGLSSREEKAVLFEYLKGSSAKNPYGRVPNYLGFGATDSVGGGRSYGSSGGRSQKTKPTTEKEPKSKVPSWEDFLKDYISHAEDVSGVKFKDWDSPMDAAYRRKINAILKKTSAN